MVQGRKAPCWAMSPGVAGGTAVARSSQDTVQVRCGRANAGDKVRG